MYQLQPFDLIWIAFLTMMLVRILMPIAIKHASLLGLIDKPNARKVHKAPIPLVGGFTMVLSAFLVFAICSRMFQGLTNELLNLAPALIIFITALIDDRRGINPKLRLLLQLGAAAWVSMNGIRIESLHGVFSLHELPEIIQHVITVFIIAGVTNAYNLLDGIDGLVGSISLIITSLFGLFAMLIGQLAIAMILFSFFAALWVFLYYNRNPAKVFMGDAGSMFFGFLFASIGVLLIQHGASVAFLPTTGVSVVISALILPVTDALRVFAYRYTQGFSILTPDKSHIHHLTLLLGLPVRSVARSLIVLQLILIGIGLYFTSVIGLTWTTLLMLSIILIYSKMLSFHKRMVDWQQVVRNRETDPAH